MTRWWMALLIALIACIGVASCTSHRLVESSPSASPLDTIQGWFLEGDLHPPYDTASPARMSYHDGQLWILTYGGALQAHKPGTTEWRTYWAPGNDSLMEFHFVGNRLFCIGGGAYQETFYEFHLGTGTFSPIVLPNRDGVKPGYGSLGTFQQRLVLTLGYYNNVTRDEIREILWMQDTGWRSLSRMDSGGLSLPYRYLEGDGGLYAGTDLGIMFLPHPDSSWRRSPRKLTPSHSGLSSRVGSFHDFVQWNGNIYSLNTTQKVYVLDPRQNLWVDSLIAKRWYPADTLDSNRDGLNGNVRIYVYRDRLYVTGAMAFGNDLGSSGTWVWVDRDKSFWHLPLYYPTRQWIRDGLGTREVTDLAFVGDTIYCAASSGVWKYPISLVP